MKKLCLLPALLFILCAYVNAEDLENKLPLDKKTSNNISRQIKRALAQAVIQHNNQTPAPEQEKKPICQACGEEIKEPHQHCAATEYTGVCTPALPAKDKQPAVAPCVCPRCGQEYTIDEKYHDVPHKCPQNAIPRGGNGGEPETDPIFVGTDASTQTGGNGGEPETEYFYVVSEDPENSGNAGEPEGNYYLEVDMEGLQQAEALLKADRDEHEGQAQHTLEYYYKKVLSAKANQK